MYWKETTLPLAKVTTLYGYGIRYVGIKEWIVEPTAKDDEAAATVTMMPSRETDSR